MSLARVLIRNMLGNWVGFAVQLMLAFFMTPFVLRSLGDARYGVWAIMMGLTGYYGLLDVGFRAGLTQYLARSLAVRDFDRLNRTASTGFAALSICGAIVIVASLLVSGLAPRIFHVPGELIHEVRWGIIIVGIGTAAQFIFFPFSAVINAAQRNEVASAIGVVTRLLQAGLTWIVLSRGGGLIGLSLLVAGANLLDYLMRWRAAIRILPELRVSLRLASWASCWEFTSFGLWNVLITGSQQLILATDAIVLGFFVPAAAIARFALAGNLNNHFGSVFRPLAMAYYPALAQLDARSEKAALRELYLAGSRLMAVVTLCGAAVAGVWAEDFFRLWVGESYLNSLAYASVPSLFYVLLGASVLHGTQRIGLQLLLATQRHRLCAMIVMAEGLLNLLLSVLLIPHLGLKGCAIGTLIPAVLMQGFVQPFFIHRVIAINCRRYVVEVLIRPIVAAVFVLGSAIGLHSAERIESWTEFVLFGCASALAAAICAVMIGMRKDERNQFGLTPLRQFVSRLRFPKKASVVRPTPSTIESTTSTKAS